MRAPICAVVVLSCVVSTLAASLPSFLKPCSASDPNLNKCIENVIATGGRQFVQGIPDLGIEPLDPVSLGKVLVNNPSLKVTFDNTTVTGLSGFKVNSYKIDLKRGKAALDFTANVTLNANYDIDGKVLILPIKGHGLSKIKITNLNIVISYDYKTINGFWTVIDHKDSYKMDRAQFKFTNLFGGNKELATTIHRVINENWEPVINDIARVPFYTIINACVNEAKKLFAAVPANQLLLP